MAAIGRCAKPTRSHTCLGSKSAIAEWLRHHALDPPPHTVQPLGQAAEAHERLERRSVDGRVLLVPPRDYSEALSRGR